MKEIQKKMRVQLFDTEMNQLSDRLLSQDIEMYHGPKEPHEGPLKIEFCLFDRNDIDACIGYLKKISGSIPIETKIRKSSKALSDTDANYRDDILAKVKEMDCQEDVIKFLRGEGFVFLTSDDVKDYDLFEPEDESFQWMLKLTREAKDPANNKYDLALRFGFKIMGKKEEIVWTSLFGKSEQHILPWKTDKAFNFKKVNLTKFPSYMVEEERLKFSKELAKLRRDPELQPTKFFKRWMAFAEFTEKDDWIKKYSV